MAQDFVGEKFKRIEDYPDYEISNHGRVKSYKWGRERLLKNSSYCYSIVILNGCLGRKTFQVHRLVAQHFLPARLPHRKYEVNHKDGDKLNNHFINLEWATRGENNRHAVEVLGKVKSPLSSQDILEIRAIYGYFPVVDIAANYGVSKATIFRVVNRETWAHI